MNQIREMATRDRRRAWVSPEPMSVVALLCMTAFLGSLGGALFTIAVLGVS